MEKGFVVEKIAMTPYFHIRAALFGNFSAGEAGEGPLATEVNDYVQACTVRR
jgi:hypothetical protein